MAGEPMSDRLTWMGEGASEQPAVAQDTIKDFLVSAALHQLDRVRYFVETRGLHPDTTYGGKPTALCYVVLKPHHDLMRYVLSKGADTNRQDGMGMTPLHYAAMGGCVYCMASLISHGARINIENRLGQTPLAMTLEKPHLAHCREFLQRHGASRCESEVGTTQFH